jgi:transglutaminase-like putative cysteine protease
MKKKPWFLFSASILVLFILLAGCEVIYPPTMYEPTPTKIGYDISYGYQVNCSDVSKYEINYFCDVPTVLVGTVTRNLLYPQEYQTETSMNNTIIHWNISGKDERSYTIGITAHVIAESFLVSDLNGENAFDTQALFEQFPTIVEQYTQPQVNQTIRYIDPNDPNIITIAQTVVENAKTNNSFLQAQSLFTWLKENIDYQLHPGEEGARPAAITLQKGNGDCDDLSFLYISLCRSVGIPARFIRGYLLTVSGGGTVTAIAHAWVEVFVGGAVGNNGWVPVECACIVKETKIDIEQNFGIEDAFHLRLFVDNGSNQSLTHYFSNIVYTTYNGHIQPPQPFVEIHNYQELESQKLVISAGRTRQYE